MIKFFRKIRQRLLTENKFSKYLLYAIGEIALVMIGILLALQVNNWNEERKERTIEQEIYENILTDINEDRNILKERINLSRSESELLYSFVHNAYKIQKSTKDYKNLLAPLTWNADNFILQDKTFDELISSGKLSIIKDKFIKNKILDYYKNYDIAKTHIAELNQTSISMLSNSSKITASMKYYGLKEIFDEDYMFKSSDWEHINNPTSMGFRLAEQAAGYYFFKNQLFINYFKKQDSIAQKLITSIDSKMAN